MSKDKTFQVHALGCRTNQYEIQGFRKQLEELGYREGQQGQEVDVVVVNTCTVTAQAHKESLRVVQKFGKTHPHAKIFVTGCASDGQVDQFARLAQVCHVEKNGSKELLLQSLSDDLPEFSITQFEAHTRAFVKVQDGCNSFCTYCIIPYVRGRSRSRGVAQILEECRGLIKNGYQELVLTGINIGDFEDQGVGLADLVRMVDQIDGLKRLRLSSIDPDEVDDNLLSAIIDGKNTCPSMHIVLQSGSNRILKRMNRKYTRQMFLDTVERLRAARPGFTFTTDVIVGFPGESDYDFHETLEVMEQVRFAKVHMFPFSVRERTRASLYTDQIAPEVMGQRKSVVLRRAEKMAYALRQEFEGQMASVLIESIQNGVAMGHTEHFLPVSIQGPVALPNQIVQVCLESNQSQGFVVDAVDNQAAV